MSSIWSGLIHREINDFDVISICQYAQSMCGGPYTFTKCTSFSDKKLPQKTVNGILTISTTCYIRHVSILINFIPKQVHKVRFPLQTSTKHDVFSPESTLATTSVMRKRCACESQNGCAHKTVPKTSSDKIPYLFHSIFYTKLDSKYQGSHFSGDTKFHVFSS